MHADSFHDDVRSQAARALPGCVVAAQEAQPSSSPQQHLSEAALALCRDAVTSITLTASTDPVRSVVCSCLSALTEVLDAVPEASESQAHTAHVVAILVGVLPSCSSLAEYRRALITHS
jgi:hypothetical protein